MPLSWPQSATIQEIMRDLMPDLSLADPVFEVMPVMEKRGWNIIWDQMDNIRGLQQVRGLDGSPPVVKPLGSRQYSVTPGVYGEYIQVTEEEMVTRRLLGTFADPMDVRELSQLKIQQLLARRLARWKWLCWAALANGTYTVSGVNGATLHTDTFKFQQFASSTLWSTFASSTPEQDFQAVNLLHRGHGVSFGPDAIAFMNTATYNLLPRNTNAADIAGRRTNFGATLNSPSDMNTFFQGIGLPSIRLYDEGYIDDNGVFQLWLPFGKVVVVGKRTDGQKVANLVTVSNAENPNNAPGPYSKVIDFGDRQVPRKIEFHDGANVAPIVWYPSSVVVMTVA